MTTRRLRQTDLARSLNQALDRSTQVVSFVSDVGLEDADPRDLKAPKVRQQEELILRLQDELDTANATIADLEERWMNEIDLSPEQCELLETDMSERLLAMDRPESANRTNMTGWKYIEKYFDPDTLARMYNEGLRNTANALQSAFVRYFRDSGADSNFAEYLSDVPVASFDGVNHYT